MAAIPKSQSTVRVSIISPNRVLGVPAQEFLTPIIPGTTFNDTPCLCFLIEHGSGNETTRMMFDLGMAKDFGKVPPAVAEDLNAMGATIDTPKDMAQILEEKDLKPNDVHAVILSHWHFDHMGDLSAFPPSTKLIVGPGFKQELLPGYPAKLDSTIPEGEIDKRDVQELDFSKYSVEICGLRAIDFFQDGSLYLLETPGHAVGHFSALARTTASSSLAEESTYLFLAGDACHHSGALRPSALDPLSLEVIREQKSGPLSDTFTSKMGHDGVVASPFFRPADGKFNMDCERMAATLRSVRILDADPNIFVLLAHDHWLLDIVDMFPKYANEWKEKQWRERARWRFLRDFE